MHALVPFRFKGEHRRPKYLHLVLQKSCHPRLVAGVIYFQLSLPWGRNITTPRLLGESIKQQRCYGAALPSPSKEVMGKGRGPPNFSSPLPLGILQARMGPKCSSLAPFFSPWLQYGVPKPESGVSVIRGWFIPKKHARRDKDSK